MPSEGARLGCTEKRMFGKKRPREPDPPPRPCPECGRNLEPYKVKGFELDRCTVCRAIWFDTFELAAVARCGLPAVTETGPSKRRCPKCELALQQRRMGPVLVDGCTRCHGVFLDNGEYERLRKGRVPVRLRGWSQLSKPLDESEMGPGLFLPAVVLLTIAMDDLS